MTTCHHAHTARVISLIYEVPCGPEHSVCRECGAVEELRTARLVLVETGYVEGAATRIVRYE